MMIPSTCRETSDLSRCASTSGSERESHRNSCSPRRARTCSTLTTSEVKKGFAILGTTIPTVSVRLRRSELAMMFPEYPRESAARLIVAASSSETGRDPDSARDTVAVDTPASSATSRMVALRMRPPPFSARFGSEVIEPHGPVSRM